MFVEDKIVLDVLIFITHSLSIVPYKFKALDVPVSAKPIPPSTSTDDVRGPSPTPAIPRTQCESM